MQLVRSGYSWSGKERNCVFLNTNDADATGPTPYFANASALSGLDFADDGRGMAFVDWDNDGDLDVWLRNRSAPRLRLMRNMTNELATQSRSVILDLVGTTSNRDAIGARAELIVKDQPAGKRLVRTVRAGDAFLSQSSRRLHFGLPNDAEIEKVVVTWPDGSSSEFEDRKLTGRYRITQGSDDLAPVAARAELQLESAQLEPLVATDAARVVLPGRVPFPPIPIEVTDGNSVDIEPMPTLFVFWTSSCANCREELTDIANHAKLFNDANLRVASICLDSLDNSLAATDSTQFLKGIDFPFVNAKTNDESMDLLRHFQNALFGKQPNFVVPLSFLMDTESQLVSIYRGSFSHETFLQDRGLVDLSDEDLRAVATPLPGTWITKPATRSQFAEFVGARLAEKFPTAARLYYDQAKAPANRNQ